MNIMGAKECVENKNYISEKVEPQEGLENLNKGWRIQEENKE